jgi:hypothetical protein
VGVVIRPVALLRVAVVGDHLLAAAVVATGPPVESRPAALGAHRPALPVRRPARLLVHRPVTVRPRVSLVTVRPPVRLATALPRVHPVTVPRPGNLAARLRTLRRARPPAGVCLPATRRPVSLPVRPDMDLPVVHLLEVHLLEVRVQVEADISRRARAAMGLPAPSLPPAVGSETLPATGPPAAASAPPAASVRPAAPRRVAMVHLVAMVRPAVLVRPGSHRPRPAPRAPGFRWRP